MLLSALTKALDEENSCMETKTANVYVHIVMKFKSWLTVSSNTQLLR